MKNYEMVSDDGTVLRVQFSNSNKSNYSCPLSCDIAHFHYAKKINGNDIINKWSVQSNDDNNDLKYNVNGVNIISYQIINIKKMPKSIPPIIVDTDNHLSSTIN